MGFIADLHVHSHYSRATSPDMTPEGLWRWAQLKGISVIGTGDFTHPQWFSELQSKLEESAEGLFSLNNSEAAGDVPASCESEVRFILQAEISSIYKKNGRTRKVHSILLAPGFKSAGRIKDRLGSIGNISSDGRPILGLDAKSLLEIVLEVSPDAMLIPAHAWTPHFSVFGAVSGFDSLEACFEELTPHVCAVETGLSSDPPMNRRLSALDDITLISNSDAHSPQKLGREANVFNCGLSYGAIISALRTRQGFEGTIEFFPEEGKYHMDGHRKCGVMLDPEETARNGFLCPVCKRKLTVGVMNRVQALADRKNPKKENFRSIIPLQEIVAECEGRGVNTKGVQGKYFALLEALGPEFGILLDVPLDDIRRAGGDRLAEAISKMREGDIFISPGFDGEFGTVKIFDAPEKKKKTTSDRTPARKTGKKQSGLF